MQRCFGGIVSQLGHNRLLKGGEEDEAEALDEVDDARGAEAEDDDWDGDEDEAAEDGGGEEEEEEAVE